VIFYGTGQDTQDQWAKIAGGGKAWERLLLPVNTRSVDPSGGLANVGDRQMLDYAIAKREGGVYLRLSPEQYARLRQV
jgi:hypothetical protein